MSKALSLIFLALPLYLVRFSVGGVPTTLLELLIWALFLIAAWRERWWRRANWPQIDRATLVGVVGLFAAGVISLFVTPELSAGLGLFKGFLITPLLAFILLRAHGKGFAELYWRAYVVSSLVLAGWGITEWLVRGGAGYRAHGPFESPNYLAFYLVPVFFYLIYRVVEVRRRSLRLLHASELVIVLAALLVTGSRGAYLGLAAGFFVLVPYLFGKLSIWRRLIGSVGLGLSTLLIFGSLLLFSDRLQTSDNIRRIVWSRSGELIAAHPLQGVGLGGFHRAMTGLAWPILDLGHRVARDVSNAHNLYFTFWLNLGLLGLASLLWLIAVTLRAVWRRRTEPLVWVSAAALVAILAHGLVDTPIWKNDLFVIFWLIVATPWLVDKSPKQSKP